MSYYCEEDREEFERSYIDILKLFGKDNKTILDALKTRLKRVDVYSSEYVDNEIKTTTPGKTGYENNINGKVYIKLRGFGKSNKSKSQIQHYFRHELCHVFSIAAQDVFSTRRRAGINKDNIPYFHNTKFGNSEYLGISGSIYRKCDGNEKENMIYGGGFCETMTDLFAISSKVASNSSIRERGINIDTVFKRPVNEWNKEEITTGYFPSIPIARLAIASFSNYPNPQYQNIIDSGASIFSTMLTDTNVKVKINDFIYGSMCDPIYIAEEYDKISGQIGSYFQLCQVVDRIVDNFANRRPVSNQDIQTVIQKLDTFAKLRSLVKAQQGVFSKQYADRIYEEFLKIKTEVEKEYCYKEKPKKYNGQDLGKAGLGTPKDMCENVQEYLNRNIGKQNRKQ